MVPPLRVGVASLREVIAQVAASGGVAQLAQRRGPEQANVSGVTLLRVPTSGAEEILPPTEPNFERAS